MNLTKLETKIKLRFSNPDSLLNAFVHRSYLNEHKDFLLGSNERLEFLGDACLELVVSEYLYQHFPEEAEGFLTNLRSALVNTESLAETAKFLGLGEYLLLSKGEEDGGGRQSRYLLANTFEALLGACYLETGLDKCREFVERFLLPKLELIIENNLYRDAKSRFQELTQEVLSVTPQYKIIETWGPDHEKHFKAGVFVNEKNVGEGEGNSKQKAEVEAAQDALEKWEGDM
ncbi:ribonuclease III [Patescibacteria group bacterium]|nr:ribonuclease III [Patescibacteria group bacterium]MBU1868113.1 ribonuclease III [Patescibacteria group bacterium]